ncbi:MAG: subclass B3 metallo-beta-lactamase [Alphaproteobacteria bacterium HGW-Alphaproteobacteria-14]|nr:MAG: subclass B3 metallo-beta-lactamase [Alphaproteobacteria bacterium HGW-Alphaproteobacteria-14]
MFGRSIWGAAALALAGCGASIPTSDITARVADAQHSSDMVRFASVCEDWDDWDKPTEPFQIHGNTWYVGTCGIAAILIKGDDGAVLIDSGTNTGSEAIEANIAALGYAMRDVKALLVSHEHFDHVGGMARLQGLSAAPLWVGEGAAEVMRTGKDDPRDPQAGLHAAMAPVTGTIRAVADAEVLKAAGITLTAVATPGHTIGAMTWQWESCNKIGCTTIVYADSLSPVSADEYRFTDHPEYVAMFRKGIARLAGLECDMLLTPHPSASDMLARARTGSLQGGMTCAAYAASKNRAIDDRLAKEAAAQ